MQSCSAGDQGALILQQTIWPFQSCCVFILFWEYGLCHYFNLQKWALSYTRLAFSECANRRKQTAGQIWVEGHREGGSMKKANVMPAKKSSLSNINTMGFMLYASILLLFWISFIRLSRLRMKCVWMCAVTHTHRWWKIEMKICQREYLWIFQPKAEVDSEQLVFTEDSVCGWTVGKKKTLHSKGVRSELFLSAREVDRFCERGFLQSKRRTWPASKPNNSWYEA